MKRMAVILCGCGYKDGSEIRESVAVLWALSVQKLAYESFAPDAPQYDVVNCLTQTPMKESRNQLVEAARIARGKVRPLSELNPNNFDGILLPGGFGAAKNLCNFAERGAEGTVIPDLQRVLSAFFQSHKPIGAVCIAPAIVGLALKGHRLELTLGAKGPASEKLELMGHRHVETSANSCHIDTKNHIVTTPAYMYDNAELSDMFEGVGKMVVAVLELAS